MVSGTAASMLQLSIVRDKEIYTDRHIQLEESSRPGVLHMEKQIHVKIDKKSDLTLREVLRKIEEIQAEHPELDVFFDGDIYAICSRPRKQAEPQQ
jgi:hypothetical protein